MHIYIKTRKPPNIRQVPSETELSPGGHEKRRSTYSIRITCRQWVFGGEETRRSAASPDVLRRSFRRFPLLTNLRFPLSAISLVYGSGRKKTSPGSRKNFPETFPQYAASEQRYEYQRDFQAVKGGFTRYVLSPRANSICCFVKGNLE